MSRGGGDDPGSQKPPKKNTAAITKGGPRMAITAPIHAIIARDCRVCVCCVLCVVSVYCKKRKAKIKTPQDPVGKVPVWTRSAMQWQLRRRRAGGSVRPAGLGSLACRRWSVQRPECRSE